MKLTKRIIAFVCVIAMMLSMSAVAVLAADEHSVDEAVSANWTALSAKYSNSTKNIIAPASNSYQPRTTGFSYAADENNGIKVHSAEYGANKGTYSVAAVASKYKTPLDGFTLTLTPDDMTMICDPNNASTNISLIFSESQVTRLAYCSAGEGSPDQGLYFADDVGSNGMREVCPDGSRSLVVTVSSQDLANTDPHRATTVAIIYDDGTYKNCDGHTGWRWVFTARNFLSQSGNGDMSGISQAFQEIDFSEGLTFSIRADETLGYIVSVNGVDYYEGHRVAYFPDCSVDTFYGKELVTESLSDEDYINNTSLYLNSMTYAKNDIDLSGFGENFEGYVTIGATGTMLTDNPCDFTIQTINTHPAATWQGEVACQHESTVEETVEPTCGKDGKVITKCADCGAVVSTEKIPATGEHTPADEWVVTKNATCSAEGEEALKCTVCDAVIDTRATAVDPEAHSYEWVVVTSADCENKGTSEYKCTGCGNVAETREDDALGHDDGEWLTVIPATYFDKGLENLVCTRCDAVIEERETEVLPYVNPFIDVKETHWFYNQVSYCVKRGYIAGMTDNTFVPNGTLTRAQFVIMLAKLDGVDLTAYAEKDSGFTDVKVGAWFHNAITWAAEEGYVAGMTATTFGHSKNVTRQQLAAFFYRYASANEIDVTVKADISVFPDADKVQSYAKDAITWAVGAGIINGVKASDGTLTLSPNGNATRAQAAVMFKLFDDFRGLNG